MHALKRNWHCLFMWEKRKESKEQVYALKLLDIFTLSSFVFRSSSSFFFATKLVADKSIDPSLFMSRTFRATLVALNSPPLNGVKWI